MDRVKINTGFDELDKYLGGLYPGTINVIAGRPGMGKAALACSIAEHAARTSEMGVLYFSLKTPKVELVHRIINSGMCLFCRSSRSKSISMVANRTSELPIYINDWPRFSSDIFRERMKALDNIGLVIIDNFEKIISSDDDPDIERSEKAVETGVMLKNLAKEYCIPIIVLANLPREVDERENHIPNIRDLRESAIGEQEADCAILIYRSDYYETNKKHCDSSVQEPDAKFILAKNRNGDSNVIVNVEWDNKRGVFYVRDEIITESPVCTFDNFIVGECNNFAYKTAVSVTYKLGSPTTNPMLLWGESGQGKTHLLKSMVRQIRARQPEKKVIYVTAEEFTNEFIDTIQHKNYSEFRRKYRGADCFLLDDIQFLKNKDGIKHELYNTVQALLEAGRQVVIASDIVPSALGSIIQDGLANLLLSGVVIGIQSPDYETRKKIVRKISENDELRLPDEIIDFICDNETYNVERLIRAAKVVTDYCKYDAKEQADVKSVKGLLYPNGGCFERKEMTAGQIINLAAWYYGTTRKQILEGSNTPSENPARLAALLLCRDCLLPTDKIFTEFGKTVSEAKIVLFKHDNPQFDADLDTMRHILKCWQFGIRLNP